MSAGAPGTFSMCTGNRSQPLKSDIKEKNFIKENMKHILPFADPLPPTCQLPNINHQKSDTVTKVSKFVGKSEKEIIGHEYDLQVRSF